MRASTLRRSALAGFAVCLLAACATPQPVDTAPPPGGQTEWLDTAHGRLKAKVYATEVLSEAPVLVVFLHGDVPDPPPSYQYYFAQAAAEGYDAVAAMPPPIREALGGSRRYDDVVAAGILRPGYTDEDGDRSDGDMGFAVADNLTPEAIDAVASAIGQLKEEYGARAVILAGHSGGAGTMANILGRHPGLGDGALLVACGCDPDGFYAIRRVEDPDPFWDLPNPSLRPLALIPGVPTDARVHMVIGGQDPGADYQQTYAEALTAQGVDVDVRFESDLGHNITFTPPVFEELAELLAEFGVTAD